MDPLNNLAFIYGGIIDAFKQRVRNQGPRLLPKSRLSVYDPLIARMMEKDRTKRATITEVCEMLAEIGSKLCV
jgi:hypothetical protein